MRKKELEILLESLDGFKYPKIALEQYATPPKLAAFILNQAQLFEDLKVVVDLGCGTGILAVGASLLGAYSIGFDVDIEVLKIAMKNAAKMNVEADFIASRVEDVSLRKSVTTIMNPPFGIQKKHADRPFLEKAFEISDVIYSIHSAGSEKFVKKLASIRDFRITHLWKFEIPLKKTYSFHEKAFKYIPVEVFRIQRNVKRL